MGGEFRRCAGPPTRRANGCRHGSAIADVELPHQDLQSEKILFAELHGFIPSSCKARLVRQGEGTCNTEQTPANWPLLRLTPPHLTSSSTLASP